MLMGARGEQTLVSILDTEPANNHKFRTCIVRALALADVQNPAIDFVLEMLFKTASDKNADVRKASMISLDILRKKTQMSDEVTYLKARNLLPFFYKRLGDKNKAVRESA